METGVNSRHLRAGNTCVVRVDFMSRRGCFYDRQNLDYKVPLVVSAVLGLSAYLTSQYPDWTRQILDDFFSWLLGVPSAKVGYYVVVISLAVSAIALAVFGFYGAYQWHKGPRAEKVPNKHVEKLNLKEAEESVRKWLEADMPRVKIIAIDSSGGTSFTLGVNTFKGVGFHGIAADEDDGKHEFDAIYNSETREIVKRQHKKKV